MRGFGSILTGVTLSVFLGLTPLGAERRQGFGSWLVGLRKEALVKGISQSTLDHALEGLEPMPQVIELDRNQPEFTLTLVEYFNRVVTERRVAQGRKKLTENRNLLEQISEYYGVQPRFLVALWGIETNFGRWTGDFPVIRATATLAHDGRRSTFFRKELLHALRILDQGHISADKMMGSWAGAMGQFQFMPSSFHNFAVDHDGDGRVDIWNNLGDGFASAANYLSHFGWVRGQNWGQKACLPTQFDQTCVGLEIQKPLSEWQTLGVRPLRGQDLSDGGTLIASILQPDGPEGQVFLVYDNYRTLLSWNRSHHFGITVGMLADRIAGS
jgi:membrane-bound lytic murein transglycosylase B